MKPGRLTSLIGPSGSGKTTLMRAIVGLQHPSRGSIAINGVPARVRQLRGKIGYVTQSPAIYYDLAVEQNLTYFETLISANSSDVLQVLRNVDLVRQRKQLASTLSGGQRARVSLAVALLGDPETLILDEPTVGLDPVMREHLWTLFRALADEGTESGSSRGVWVISTFFIGALVIGSLTLRRRVC